MLLVGMVSELAVSVLLYTQSHDVRIELEGNVDLIKNLHRRSLCLRSPQISKGAFVSSLLQFVSYSNQHGLLQF